MNIETSMSKNIIVGNYDDSIKHISNLMKQYNIGFIPIVKKNKIVGVITDRDIVIRALSNGTNAEDSIEGYMTSNPVSCNLSSSIDEILEIMKEHKIKRILVKKDKKVVGVISISDILSSRSAFETLKSIYEINNNYNTNEAEIDEFYL